MNSQLFFLLNLVFGGLFLWWFLSGRKDGVRPPTSLDLRKGNSNTGAGPTPALELARRRLKEPSARPLPTTDEIARMMASTSAGPKTKTLNVLFLYNGHDWDAYEVLGLPAGAGLATVTERYQQMIKDSDEGRREFLEAAYSAILKKF